ncbi:hypothetical protein P3T73_15825 [Kiritimatiellota bacterium B12222]|nr:hypothetical protein P3T73_15825 [Kiritimatiellota bacterium B12222]
MTLPQSDSSDAQKLQTLKMITLALMGGATSFLLVALYLVFTSTFVIENRPESFLPFAVMVGATWGVSLMLKRQFEQLFSRRFAGDHPWAAYQTLTILRLALSEGPALFGLVGLMIFAPGAAKEQYSKLIVFIFPYLGLIGTGLRHFPSQEKFKDQVRVAKENKASVKKR